jgi:hypothetical protein
MSGTVDTALAKEWPNPKVASAEVARVALQAVIDAVEDVIRANRRCRFLPNC